MSSSKSESYSLSGDEPQVLSKGYGSQKPSSEGDSGGLVEEMELLNLESANISVSGSSKHGMSVRSNVETMLRRGDGRDGL